MNNRQQMIFEFIKSYIAENRYSPTTREITSGIGLNSSSTVHGHLVKMRKNGYINYIDSFPRTISIVEGQ
ncbi:LexA family protein [Sporosarcina sp. FSL K6-5500]|uniref:LexA family protein n=1 Tax=Sporosarcina sp. FSL K6-5500 TaxID=2921558 RepID=UPI0030F74E6C